MLSSWTWQHDRAVDNFFSLEVLFGSQLLWLCINVDGKHYSPCPEKNDPYAHNTKKNYKYKLSKNSLTAGIS